MEPNKIGSFTLGNCPWTIEVDNEFCKERNIISAGNVGLQIIKVKDRQKDVIYSHENVNKNIWYEILDCIIRVHMERRKIKDKFIQPLSLLVHQVTCSLNIIKEEGEYSGTFNVGGRTYNIITDNEFCNRKKVSGLFNPIKERIVLCTETLSGEYKEEYILQTLWHEILHCIMYEIGYGEHREYNSEEFINILSIFLYEVHKTIEINYGTNKETS